MYKKIELACEKKKNERNIAEKTPETLKESSF